MMQEAAEQTKSNFHAALAQSESISRQSAPGSSASDNAHKLNGFVFSIVTVVYTNFY